MDKVNALLRDSVYMELTDNIMKKEQDRKFCRHGISHSLDVARIAYILSMERGYGFDKEVIYGMALLHDIGRYTEEENGVSHHLSGALVADGILQRAGYDKEQRIAICNAIRSHRNWDKGKCTLESLLFEADKRSRNCFVCPVRELCYWEEDRKNKTIYR